MTGEPPAATRLRAHSLIRCCVPNESGMYACSAMPARACSKPGPIERPHEHLGRELLVAILLHVEIDELGHDRAVAPLEPGLRRRAKQQLQPVAQHVDRVLAGQRRNLRIDRRNLDRDHFDLRLLQRGQITLQPPLGVFLAQQRLAQEVDVHPHAFFPAGPQMLGQQLALGRQNDVRRLVLHPLLHERHRHARQVRAERLKAQQQRAIERAEEPRHALHVENVDELIGRPMRPPRAKRLIRELHQRRLVVRRLDHAIQLGLLPPLLRRLQLAGPPAQLAGQMHGLLHFERCRRRAVARDVRPAVARCSAERA